MRTMQQAGLVSTGRDIEMNAYYQLIGYSSNSQHTTSTGLIQLDLYACTKCKQWSPMVTKTKWGMVVVSNIHTWIKDTCIRDTIAIFFVFLHFFYQIACYLWFERMAFISYLASESSQKYVSFRVLIGSILFYQESYQFI